MHFPARTLLACWLTLVATGTDVAHRHAAAADHTHGFGLARLGTPSGRALPRGHRHLVLLGVEFGAVPGEPAGEPDGPQPVQTSDALPATDAEGDGDSPTDQLDLWLAHPLHGFTDGLGTAADAPVRASSPFAAPARSSVLRL
jgi:hypothetical protein